MTTKDHFPDISEPSKEERKRLLIEMMKEDEKNGMYEDSAKNAQSDNELIAEFMGYTINRESHNAPVIYYPDGDYSYISDAGFELYWDRLMPVVEKIEGLHNGSFRARIVADRCVIYDSHKATNTEVSIGGGVGIIASAINQPSKLTAVYHAVVQFIKWYNSQQHERK